jgi:replication factor A1
LSEENESLAPHIEELKRALGNSVTEEKIKEELNKYFEYGVTPVEAKKAIVKKLGGDPNTLFTAISRTLAEVLPSDSNIDMKAKVLSINTKTVTVQGEEKDIFYGLLADQTMVRPFTAWEDFQIQKNDVVHIHSAYAKDWRGEPQINFGNKTSVERLDDPDLAALDTSNLPNNIPSAEFNIGSLKDGLSNIIITGRIISLEQRTVNVKGEEKEIYTGILADSSGKIAFTAWSDFKLKEDEVIKVDGAYIRTWRGVPKLNFDERMEVIRCPQDSLPPKEKLNLEKVTRIDMILELGGGMDISIEGTILDIKEGSGLILRCPECKRVLRNDECMVHGTQTGVADLRVKAVVDDGSGAIMTVLNTDLASEILGKSVEECETQVRDQGPEQLNEIFEEFNEKLLLHPWRFKGNVTTDDYGAMMICSELDQLVLTEEVQVRAKEILENFNGNWSQEGT